MIWPPPISAFVGVNGSGKTLAGVAVALSDQKKRGRPIITNVGGFAGEHYHIDAVEELPDLMAVVGTSTVLLDEAGAMFASRDTGRNKAFERAVQQLRKYDCRLIWTAPAFGRADKILREVTFSAVVHQSLWKVHQRGKVWPSTRYIMQSAFDVSRLDNSAMAINRNAKRKGYGFLRTGRWQDAFDSFSTAGLEVSEQAEELKRTAFRPSRRAEAEALALDSITDEEEAA